MSLYCGLLLTKTMLLFHYRLNLAVEMKSFLLFAILLGLALCISGKLRDSAINALSIDIYLANNLVSND